MGWRALRAGWHHSAIPDGAREDEGRRLDAVCAGTAGGTVLEDVHQRVRSSVRLHTRVHWVQLRVAVREQRLRSVPGLLGPMVLAPVSSLGRRLGGLPADAPQDASLAATWARVWTRARGG